jgi:uncharacterized membrane protein YoaK (UPF0700 family)
MLINPLLASLVAFALAVLLMEATRTEHKQSARLHMVVLVLAVGLSVFVPAYTSSSPEASGGHMFYLWMGYAALNLLFRRKRGRAASTSETGATESE